MKPRLSLWFIVVVVVLAVWANAPAFKVPERQFHIGNWSFTSQNIADNLLNKFPLHLGLDLTGGMELTLETDMSKIDPANQDDALESARQVIEKRVNLYGVSEATVQSARVGSHRRILVQLPGVKDASAAADLVGRTANLEFRELPASPSSEQVEATKSGIPDIYFAVPTGITGSDLVKAQVTYGASQKAASGPQVEIQFNSDGAQKFADVTRRNIGKPLAIYLDNQLIEAPNVSQEILGGNAVISGQFSVDQAKQLAIQLNAGALPVPVSIVSQSTIPATLGAESVRRSLIAGIVGVGTVMLFMLAYYGLYGLLADIALIIYTMVTLAVMRTGLFLIPPVTLSLAGIAGLILSIGMAVDANILIFERMKEERRSGKSGRAVLNLGFARAWSSIRDSNISSLITAAILYTFGTSVVRGFALTLAIGVLISMFSAIMVTKTLLRVLPRFKK